MIRNEQTFDIDVAREDIDVCLPIGEISRLLEKMPVACSSLGTHGDKRADVISPPRRSMDDFKGRHCVRAYVNPAEGEGYWDFFKISSDLFVSINDTTYTTDKWCAVQSEGLFKIRILLEGSLQNSSKGKIMEGPDAMLATYPDNTDDGYYFARGERCRLVILHCRTDLLRSFGFDPAILEKCDPSLKNCGIFPGNIKLSLGPSLLSAATDIVDSRHRYGAAVRRRFLEAKSIEIICSVIHQLTMPKLTYVGRNRITSDDTLRLIEARDILQTNFVDPPKIARLARMTGLNETKLRGGFKEMFGFTVHAFIQNCRMSNAVKMLTSSDISISDIAYEVGYEHPTNFTQAFKRHFGYGPKALRKQHSMSRDASSVKKYESSMSQ